MTYHPTEDEELTLDFTPPFKKVSLIVELEKALKVKFPPADQLDTEGYHHVIEVQCSAVCVTCCLLNFCAVEARRFLSDLCDKHGVECRHPRTTARLIDKVSVWSVVGCECWLLLCCWD